MSVTTDRELQIENTICKLAGLLDEEYSVKNEFYSVLLDSINKHIELIAEQEELSYE